MSYRSFYWVLCVALICITPGLAAAKDKLSIDLGHFPKGTDCTVHGTTGSVKKRFKRKEIKFTIKGDTRSVTVECTLPDGRMFSVDTAPLVRNDTNFTSLQLNSDNKGSVLWDNGGLQILKISGFIRPK